MVCVVCCRYMKVLVRLVLSIWFYLLSVMLRNGVCSLVLVLLMKMFILLSFVIRLLIMLL